MEFEDKFDLYFGIRPTAKTLHLGHVMTLFNMFDTILHNKTKVNHIYILMAEIHAEISTVPINEIRENSLELRSQIFNLFYTFLKVRGVILVEIYEMLDKLKIIMQYDNIVPHILLTYKFLTLCNTNTLLKNPIFKNGNNNSAAFLLYPVLQTFDVIIYTEPNIPVYVFVGNDQHANINILKDICKKLKLEDMNIKIDTILYDNILYDNKSDDKMSKSLNNFVEFDNITEITKYIKGFITYSRSIDELGNYQECPFYKRFGKECSRLFPNYDINFELCNTGQISCKDCKNKIVDIFINICSYLILSKETFKKEEYDWTISSVDYEELFPKYISIGDRIETVRSNKE